MKSSENESSNSSDTIPQENGINNSHILLLDGSAISTNCFLVKMQLKVDKDNERRNKILEKINMDVIKEP